MQSGISLSNKDAILNFNLGNEKLKQGDIKAAIGFYSKSIQINPEYYKAFLNRAYAYARIEHYSEALADFDSAIDINPSLGEAYLGKGSCYHFLGIKEKACKYWNQAYSLGNGQALLMMDRFCRQQDSGMKMK
jgi:tetratricopeptide (TPR) repeat protein